MSAPKDREPPAQGGASPEGETARDLGGGERALLRGFEGFAPAGGLRWGFDDSMTRLSDPRPPSSAVDPWPGLPADLWQRGRSARVGERFVGDVAGVLAEVLASDARHVADRAVASTVGDRFTAAWDALRYLAARVERLEEAADPLAVLDIDVDPSALPARPDVGRWAERVGDWLPSPAGDPPGSVFVGESGVGELALAVAAYGYSVVSVDPSGPAVWALASRIEALGSDGVPREAVEPRIPVVPRTGIMTVLGQVDGILAGWAQRSLAAAVLVGRTDQAPVAGKCRLLQTACRAVVPGGKIVVLTTDQQAWDAALPAPARDLLPGRPLHPETWMLLMERVGIVGAEWLRSEGDGLHLIVGVVR